MSSSTLITEVTEQEKKALWTDIKDVTYQGRLVFDASPAAVELFIGGINGRRLQLPEDTMVCGYYTVGIWNESDDTAINQFGVFSVGNDGGTTAVDPAELDVLTNFAAGSGSNPLIIAGGTMEGTLAIAADNTNDALTVNYTGAANDTYSIRVRLHGMVIVGEGVVLTPIPTQTQTG